MTISQSDKLRGKNAPWFLRASKWSYQSFWHQQSAPAVAGNKSDSASENETSSTVRITELSKQDTPAASRRDIESADRSHEVSRFE